MSLSDRWLLARAALRNAIIPTPTKNLPDFVQQVLRQVIQPSKDASPHFLPLNTVRKSWLAETKRIQITDLGAGSHRSHSTQRSVASLVRHSSTPPRFSRLLTHLIQFMGCTTVAELGTSVGLNTLYLRLALPPHGQLFSFEGCPEIAQWAIQGFEQYASLPIQTIIGDLDQTWPTFMAKAPPLDLVYMDANHRLGPTLQYFDTMLPKLHPGSIVVVDDIYWSREMKKAWHSLRSHPQVSLSIDVFEAGLLFFNPELPSGSYRLRY
ncbi:MAG: class I SAM-dependent methyltransferase [Bacteroidota bacterium]